MTQPATLGLDFGTTNTVVAYVRETAATPGTAAPVQFEHAGELSPTFASALCFWEEDEGDVVRMAREAGPWAIERFLAEPEDSRFLQSMKSFAASRLFEGTSIFDRFFRFEELLATFFERLQSHGGATLVAPGTRLVVGRPVDYVGARPDAALAMRRYRQALATAGYNDLFFVYEPVAAAFFFARRLKRAATVLVADFGGGTTDYSIMRFEAGQRAYSLAHSGAGIAGDRFDYRIIDKVISPRLGKGSLFEGEGKILEVPDSSFASFGNWHQLSVLASSREFRELKQLITWAKQPEPLRRLVQLVESGRGFTMYQAVARAKTALTRDEQTVLHFETPDLTITTPVSRAEFEHWIRDDLEVMERALQTALDRAGLDESGIDRVFLTGGTSFVPAVRRIFERRFGSDCIESGDEFESIANGLALIGQRKDLENWIVPG